MCDLFHIGSVRLDRVNFVNLAFRRACLIRIIASGAIDDALTIWRPMRVNRVRIAFRHLMWYAAVQIDHKDFIVPGAIRNKRDLFSIG